MNKKDYEEARKILSDIETLERIKDIIKSSSFMLATPISALSSEKNNEKLRNALDKLIDELKQDFDKI